MAFNSGGGSGAISGATDVALSSVSNDQVLTYNTSTSKWTNKTMTAAGGNLTAADVGAVATTSPNMQLDYGTSLPPAGEKGRFFIVVPE